MQKLITKKHCAVLAILTTILCVQISPSTAQLGPGSYAGAPLTSLRICTRQADGAVNIRSGPGTQYGIRTQIVNSVWVNADMSKVVNDGEGLRWIWVRYGGIIGWVRGDYLCD
jgi:hypothetical protein